MQYVLSPYYQLKQLAYLKNKFPDAPEIAQLKPTENFILVKQQKKDFIINRDIYQFLQFLQAPQTLNALQEQFPEEPNLTDFLQKMLKRKVIIDAATLPQFPDLSKTKQRFEVGSTVEKYRILELLVSKKETEIYLAGEAPHVIIKALKLPTPLSETQLQLLKRKFSKEFQLMKTLPKNNHLPQLLAFNEKEGYGVLQFVAGKTLHQFLKTTNPIATIKVSMIQQLIRALSFLHQHKIVHGDLHHRNVIVSDSNKVTLLDFGLSHFHNTPNQEKLRKGGLDAYLPPERIHKSAFQALKKPANLASDIYQLGILLYLILYQKFPFTAFTWDALYDAIQQGQVTYPSLEEELIAFIPIVKRCLQKSPLARFENAQMIPLAD